jgi:hypothetical protein
LVAADLELQIEQIEKSVDHCNLDRDLSSHNGFKKNRSASLVELHGKELREENHLQVQKKRLPKVYR